MTWILVQKFKGGSAPSAPTGWTTVNPVTPTQAPSGVGAGSRLIYVSSSTGSDANAGTINAPLLTIQNACTFLRAGKSDQLFLANGDVWTLSDASDTGFWDNVPSGASAGVVRTAANLNIDLSCTGPILLDSYQRSGSPAIARPQVLVTAALASGNGRGVGGQSAGKFDNVVVRGIEFYAPKRDPGNAAYTYAEAITDPIGCYMLASVTYVLLEDCFFHHFGVQTVAFQTSNNMPNNAINLNRCIVTDAYSASGGNSQGFFANVAGAAGGYNSNVINLTNCLFDQNGWNQVLTTPAAATYSGNVFTWPSTLKFGNNAIVYCSSSGGSSIATATAYHVISTSGNTFSLSATQGGAALSTAGLPNPATLVFSDPQASTQNRNLYVDPPTTCINCISSNSSSEWASFRQAGTIQKNVAFLCTDGQIGDIVDGFSTVTAFDVGWNWILNGVDCQSIPATQSRAGGIQVNNATGTGSSCLLHDNIISHGIGPSTVSAWGLMLDNNGGVSSGNCVNITVSNNIVWDWGKGYNDLGVSTVNSGNTIDPTKANNLGAPEPFGAGAARDVASYDLSIGGPGTVAHFLQQARLNSRLGGWDVRYTANPLLNHGRTGFGLASV